MDTSKRPSLNQLAEILAERRGRQFDYAFKEEMKVLIHIWRQRILVDSLNSRPEDRKFFTVWMDLPLIDAKISDFPGFPEGCEIKRTKDCVPKSVRANSTMFDFIGMLNKETRLPLSHSMESVRIMSCGRYTGNIPRSVYINGYIYTVGFTGPAISVSFIPEDLSEVKDLECYDCGKGKSCYTDDDPYPVSGDIAQRIIQAILATELSANIVNRDIEQVPINNEER